MAQYRCYFLSGDRVIVKLEEADHADDAKAVDWAIDLHRQHPQYPVVEIRQGRRVVERRER